MSHKNQIVRSLYLYIVVIGSLAVFLIGSGMLIHTGLRTFVFRDADNGAYGACSSTPPVTEIQNIEKIKDSALATQEQKDQLQALIVDYNSWREKSTGENCIRAITQQQLASSLTMIIISLPVLWFHVKLIRKDRREKSEEDRG